MDRHESLGLFPFNRPSRTTQQDNRLRGLPAEARIAPGVRRERVRAVNPPNRKPMPPWSRGPPVLPSEGGPISTHHLGGFAPSVDQLRRSQSRAVPRRNPVLAVNLRSEAPRHLEGSPSCSESSRARCGRSSMLVGSAKRSNGLDVALRSEVPRACLPESKELDAAYGSSQNPPLTPLARRH